jgi:uncharacterized delta-60 repeat protein
MTGAQTLHRGRIRLLTAAAGAVLLFAGSAGQAAAWPGELDDSFNSTGKLFVNPSAGADFFTDVAIQASDQKIVAVGGSGAANHPFEVYRFNPDGTPDSGFGLGDGRVSIDLSPGNDYAQSVAIQADGAIVVAGVVGGSTGRWGIARLTSEGVLDSTFSGDGKKTLNFTTGPDFANDVAIDASQRILVAGVTALADSSFAVARFTSSGNLDTSFSLDGIATANMTTGRDFSTTLVVDANNKVVAAGNVSGAGGQVGLVRFTATGRLDGTFSGDGKVIRNLTTGSDAVWGMAMQADGKLVLAGESGTNARMTLLRYNTNGTSDSTFSGDGAMTVDVTEFDDVAVGIALQGDGQIVAAGHANAEMYAVIRVSSGGALDGTFGDDGVRLVNPTAAFDLAYGMAIQADGSIVAAGESSGAGGRMSLVRLLAT